MGTYFYSNILVSHNVLKWDPVKKASKNDKTV